MATIDLLEETANYLLNHCFVLGCVEEQRAKYLYIQDHLNEVRAVFKPLGYAVLLYPAPMQAAALVNEHEGSQARLLKYESILLLVLRLLYLQKRESLAASADEVLVTVEEVQAELQKMNLPRKLDQQTLEKLMRTLRRYNLARPVGRLSGLDSRCLLYTSYPNDFTGIIGLHTYSQSPHREYDITPVSYTHLDVYKRQPPAARTATPRAAGTMCGRASTRLWRRSARPCP